MTTENKFSAAPWFGKLPETGKFDIQQNWSAENEDMPSTMSAPIMANGETIALVVCEIQNWDAEAAQEKLEANARMIAAAPEMYEMIKRLWSGLEWYFKAAPEKLTDFSKLMVEREVKELLQKVESENE